MTLSERFCTVTNTVDGPYRQSVKMTVSKMTVSTVQTVEGTVHHNYCVNPPLNAFLLRKVETRVRILIKTQTFLLSFFLSFPFHYYTNRLFVYITHKLHFELRRK